MRAEAMQKRLIALATLALAGCVELSPQEMVVHKFEPVHRHPHSVMVTVDGPGYSDLWWNTNEMIQLALEETIRESEVFSRVIGVDQGAADYELKVNVNKVLQWGTYTCKTRAVFLWELFETGQSDPTWRDSIEKSCSEESGPPSTRQKRATECAVRANLNEGLRRLSELKLGPGG